MKIPEELKKYPQWVTYKGIEDKAPRQVGGKPASSTDASTWTTWDRIESIHNKGFVLTATDPFIFFDFDKCLDEEGNITDKQIKDIVDKLDSFTEISPSKTGLHVICKGKIPKVGGNRKGKIEIYEHGRYMTMTGDIYPGKPRTIEERQNIINGVHKELFKDKYEEKPRPISSATELSDDDVLEKLFTEKNGEKWKRVFHGDASDYGGDDSRADQAIMTKLTFYTQDRGQLENLFRVSGLYRKKFERDDYRNGLLDKALSGVGETYTPPREKVVEEMVEYKHPAIYTVSQIVQMELKPPRFIIPDLITEGLNLVIGKAKAGKSAYVRQAGCAIAFGGKAFGDFLATGSEVLYLNLEETLNMFQHKVKKLLNGVDAPNGYHVSCRDTIHQWGKIGHGFSERVIDYLEKHPYIKVLIIDTYGRIKPRSNEKQSDGGYLDETRILGVLMLLLKYVDCIILVHHSKKGKSEDWIDDVLGSTGLAAAADTIIRIHRERGEIDSQIDITGKAIKEQTFKAKFRDETWEILGLQKDWGHLTEERKEIYEIFDSVENSDLSPKQMADRLDKERSNINKTMLTMTGKGQLEKVQTGRYRIPGDIYRRWKEDHEAVSVDDFLKKLS